MPDIFNALTAHKPLTEDPWDNFLGLGGLLRASDPNGSDNGQSFRGAILPMSTQTRGTYPGGPSVEEPHLAWPGMVTEPLHAARSLNEHAGEGPWGGHNADDMNALIMSMFGGNTVKAGKNALAAGGVDLGTVGMFGGRQAAKNLEKQGITGPRDALARAEEMKAAGHLPNDIYRETSDMLSGTPYAGVHYGRDGLPRFEISDAQNEFLAPGGNVETFGGLDVDLGEASQTWFRKRPYWDVEQRGLSGPYVNHAEALKAYPELADRKISIDVNDKIKSRGAGVTRGGDIRAFDRPDPYLDPATPGYEGLSRRLSGDPGWMRSALAHELDHVAGDIEGFSPGGNPSMMRAHPFYKKDRGMDAAFNRMIGMPPPEGYLYQSLAGETQARNVQTRLDMPPEVRRQVPPWETQDTPYYQQVERPTAVQSWVNPYLPSFMKIGKKAAAQEQNALLARDHETPALNEPYQFRNEGLWGSFDKEKTHPNFPRDPKFKNYDPHYSDKIHYVALRDGVPIRPTDFQAEWLRSDGFNDFMLDSRNGKAPDLAKYIADHGRRFKSPDSLMSSNPDYQLAMRELGDLHKSGKLQMVPRDIYENVVNSPDPSRLISGPKTGAEKPQSVMAYHYSTDPTIGPYEGKGGKDSYIATRPNTVRSATTGETLFSDTRPSLLGSAVSSSVHDGAGSAVNQPPEYASGGAAPDLVTIHSASGVPFTVSKAYAENFLGLVNDLEDSGYPVKGNQSGGYNDRNIAGTDKKSQHAFGRAIDVNWNDNPRGGQQTIPSELAHELALKYGLAWGGDWKHPDAMHFEAGHGAPVVPRQTVSHVASAGSHDLPVGDVAPMPEDHEPEPDKPGMIDHVLSLLGRSDDAPPPMAELPRIQPASNNFMETPAMPYAANGGAIDHALFLASVRDRLREAPTFRDTLESNPHGRFAHDPGSISSREETPMVLRALDAGAAPARAYSDQFGRATDAVAESIGDPSLPNLTNAGVQSGIALAYPPMTAASGILGFGTAAMKQYAPSFIDSAEATPKNKNNPPKLKPAIFEDATPSHQPDPMADMVKGDPTLSLLYSQIQAEQVNATRDYPGRNGDESRTQAAKRVQILQTQLAEELAKRDASKRSDDKNRYDQQVDNAVYARDKARGRDRRFQDTPVGQVYDKLGGYAPLVAGSIPGALFGLAKGPAKTWGDVALRAVTGIGAGMGASNVPSAYDMTYAPAVNPEKEAMQAYAYNLPDGHPDKQKAAAYAATLPDGNPVQKQGERMFSDPTDAISRNLNGAWEGFTGQELGGLLPRAVGGVFKPDRYGFNPKSALELARAEIDAAEAAGLHLRAAQANAATRASASKLAHSTDTALPVTSGPAGPASTSGASATKSLSDQTTASEPPKPRAKPKAQKTEVMPESPPIDPATREAAASELRRYLAISPDPSIPDGLATGGGVDQSAIAHAIHLATGGSASPPWYVKGEARGMTGPLHSSVAGRTDHLPISVPSGSHVIPADVVSGLGEGNTNAGMNVLGHMFSSGPYGMAQGKTGGHSMKAPSLHFATPHRASGGGVDHVPIMAAGGEYVVPPEHVAAIGNGDMDLGHEILDRFILNTRHKTIQTMASLPPPARD